MIKVVNLIIGLPLTVNLCRRRRTSYESDVPYPDKFSQSVKWTPLIFKLKKQMWWLSIFEVQNYFTVLSNSIKRMP